MHDFILAWNISESSGLWTYEYTITGTTRPNSHFILEVTEDDNPFYIDDISGSHDGPSTWTETTGSGNPNIPNPIYGVKFDYESFTYFIIGLIVLAVIGGKTAILDSRRKPSSVPLLALLYLQKGALL